MTKASAQLQALISPFVKMDGGLLPALHAIQDHFGFVDKGFVPEIAKAFNQTRADVFGVLSFYHDFRQQKPPQHIVKICAAEACQAVGARSVIAEATDQLKGDVAVEKVYCLGNCACGPAAMVNGKAYGRIDAKRLGAILMDHQAGKAV